MTHDASNPFVLEVTSSLEGWREEGHDKSHLSKPFQYAVNPIAEREVRISLNHTRTAIAVL